MPKASPSITSSKYFNPSLVNVLSVMSDTANSDASGAERKEVRGPDAEPSNLGADLRTQELDTSTAILKKKKKPNSLM